MPTMPAVVEAVLHAHSGMRLHGPRCDAYTGRDAGKQTSRKTVQEGYPVHGCVEHDGVGSLADSRCLQSGSDIQT